MALRHGSSSTLGLNDLEATWEAFEAINKVSLKLTLEYRRGGKSAGIWATVEAWGEFLGEPEARLLASESARCLGSMYANLDTPLFRLLYVMDGRLASLEMAGKVKLS